MSITTGGHDKTSRHRYNKFLLSMGFLILSKAAFAATFSIVPQADLPSTVPQYGSTSAYYTITNTTSSALNGNFVKSLPNNVTQVTCDPKYCGATFNLDASESCLLKLTIKAPVNSGTPPQLLVCNQSESLCDGTPSPLNVAQGSSVPFIGIASGVYTTTNNASFPLVVSTIDTGLTWEYPRALLDNLQQNIDPELASGILRGASCTGSLDKSVCIATGSYCKDTDCFNQRPLIAVGRRNNSFWVYPGSVYFDLEGRIDPNITRAFLTGGMCRGAGNNAFCIAAGEFTTPAIQSPLLALSSNGGGAWTYPKSIFQNLQTAIDPNYNGGFLLSTSCNQSTCDSVCIATGAYSTDTKQFPVVALSTDKGQTWTYPSSVFKNLDTVIAPNFTSGELVSSSCTGTGNKTVCIGAGIFFNGSNTLPLLALTQNGGSTWTYPSSIFTNLSTQIDPDLDEAFFHAASCTGKETRARCIASGFFKRGSIEIPMLALTKDGGQTWTYPRFIFTKLKTLVNPDFRSGRFNGASCYEKNKESTCMAAGEFCAGHFCEKKFPLIAVTKDGGKTWSYPASVFDSLTTRIDPNYLHGTFNDIHCSGVKEHSFCVATGEYSTSTGNSPLVAYSTNNGDTWIYPPSVFQNLTTTISPDFLFGFLGNAATTGGQLREQVFNFLNLLVPRSK